MEMLVFYWCRGPESNRYGYHYPRDFKSLASASSATAADNLKKEIKMEATPRIELGIKVLQTSALPLGYVALKVERKTRFELATPSLARRCSTTELFPQIWCLSTESNCGHKDFQSFALPTELPRQDWRPGWDSNPRPPP